MSIMQLNTDPFVLFAFLNIRLRSLQYSTAQRYILFILSSAHSFSINMAKRLDYL